MAWSPDSKLVASGSLDTTIIIWSLQSPAKHTIIKSKITTIIQSHKPRSVLFISFSLISDAHPQSQITRLAWLSETSVISVGQDCNTKIWAVEPF